MERDFPPPVRPRQRSSGAKACANIKANGSWCIDAVSPLQPSRVRACSSVSLLSALRNLGPAGTAITSTDAERTAQRCAPKCGGRADFDSRSYCLGPYCSECSHDTDPNNRGVCLHCSPGSHPRDRRCLHRTKPNGQQWDTVEPTINSRADRSSPGVLVVTRPPKEVECHHG